MPFIMTEAIESLTHQLVDGDHECLRLLLAKAK